MPDPEDPTTAEDPEDELQVATPEQVAGWAAIRFRGEQDPEMAQRLARLTDPEYCARRAREETS